MDSGQSVVNDPYSPIETENFPTTNDPVTEPTTVPGVIGFEGNETKPHVTVIPTSLLYNRTHKSINDLLYNGTGYYIDDEEESGLTDLDTLLLACLVTLVLLALAGSTAFLLRLLWKKYRRSKVNAQYDGILHREGTSESISRPLHSHLLDDKNLNDTHLSVNLEDLEVVNGVEMNTQVRSNNHSNTNGSIITMTLKNNHLIVETEERNDLQEDSRETTMRYSPSARDGVFVVEVQQGVRRSPGSGEQTSCVDPEVSVSVGDQCALVHNPPDKYSDEETLGEYDESEYCIEMVSPETPDSASSKAKTGLTQSNTSLSHSSYCYTNQQCYDIDNYGSSQYKGYTVCDDQPVAKCIDDTRPKIMAAIYKNTLKRSPSTEDLHMASISGGLVEDSTVLRNSSNRSINDKIPTPESSKVVEKPKITGELSSSKEAETRSKDYENKGFECNDLAKS
ncbi:uncharacterized protein LOC114349406 [Diabrotica virgifera virgifera]|uniref:Uncharacterized protein n=1 Tax=Diabrotica virgifera virgifera TaxID=50390 RepID=A0ABM5KS43_DIAVI|nr:uncharacterized protein LOC114349406 [Diabrotica virgifera virgifera]